MIPFAFQILGANSAAPMVGRFPSSFVLHYDNEPILIDCGEGSQMKMSQFKIKRSRINNIFISHLHGDHVFGLPGLLNSFNLNGRKKAITLTGPKGIREFVLFNARATNAHYGFKIEFEELEGDRSIDLSPIGHLQIKAFPLQHRVPTYGYLFRENYSTFNILPDAINKYQLTIDEIKKIKNNETVLRNGRILPTEELIKSHSSNRSFAYCSDTIYDPGLVRFIKDVHTIYHEATYTHDLAEKARERMHATAKEAALTADLCNVRSLIIGHYSSRYRDLSVLLEEARAIFPNTDLAVEGRIFDI